MTNQVYIFGEFALDPAEQRLSRAGDPIALTPKAFQTLVVLVRNAGRLVEKDELVREVWPDTVVQEIGLTRNVSVLRKILGAGSDGRPYIETIPKRGYRFTADVQTIASGSVTTSLATGSPLDASPGASGWWARRRLAPAIAVLIAMSLVLAIIQRTHRSALVSRVHAIAVLPLQAIGPGADDALSIGVADAIARRISSLGRLEVRPTTAVLAARAESSDARRVAARLRTDAVITGTIRRVDGRVRAAVELVDASNGSVLWSYAFDGAGSDVFSLEDSVATGVADALLLKLTGEERHRLTRQDTANAEAHAAYIRGRFQFNRRSHESLSKSVEEFRRAIALDPTYALAYAGLADAYVIGSNWIVPASDARPLAIAAARHALDLDDTVAEAHAAVGLSEMFAWNWREGERELRRAVELDPDFAQGHYEYGLLLDFSGRFEEARRELSRAVDLDPISPAYAARLIDVQLSTGRTDQAIAGCRALLAADPQNDLAHYFLAMTYDAQGNAAAAMREARSAYERDSENYEYAELVGYLAGRMGNGPRLQEMIDRVKALKARTFVSDVAFADLSLAQGRSDHALEYLEQSVRHHDERLVALKVDPHFVTLSSHPRYRAVLKAVGLPE